MKDIKDILSRYKDGSYSPEDLVQIEAQLLNGSLSLSDLDDVVEITEVNADIPGSVSVSRMDQKFYSTLASGDNQTRVKYLKKWIFILSGLIIILTALCSYLLVQSNVELLPTTPDSAQHFASLLKGNEMIEDRIHIVSALSKQEQLNDDLLDVLLYHLMSDESTNVRLASLNTLKDYVKKPIIRQGLINAIPFQNSPIVLMHINEIVAQSGRAIAQADFVNMVNQNTRPVYKQSLQSISVQ